MLDHIPEYVEYRNITIGNYTILRVDSSFNESFKTTYENILTTLLGFYNTKMRLYKNMKYKPQLFQFRNGYNNFITPSTRILSRMVVPSSTNIQREIRKLGGGALSYDQYMRYKAYRPSYPKQEADQIIETTIAYDSTEAQLIASDGAQPQNCDGNGWKYVNTGTESNKINWYFYADGSVVPVPNPQKAQYKVGDLECFYFVVDLSNGAQINKEYNKPWITMYSQYDSDISNVATWYASRFNYAGFHDQGANNKLDSGKYLFYVGDLSKLVSYDTSIQEYKLSTYENNPPETPSEPDISYLRTHAPTLADALNQRLNLIAISTNSGADTGTFDFCISEVGYRLKGQTQFVYKLV